MQTKEQTLLQQAYQQVMEATTPHETHHTGDMNNKKTDAEKNAERKLHEFRDQLHNLLMEYPEIKITGDYDGLVRATIFTDNAGRTNVSSLVCREGTKR